MNTATTSEILVNEIVFSSQDVVSLYGFVEVEGTHRKVRYTCAIIDLFVMLRKSGAVGREMEAAIRKERSYPHASPLTFDLIEKFGYTTPIDRSAWFMGNRMDYLETK